LYELFNRHSDCSSHIVDSGIGGVIGDVMSIEAMKQALDALLNTDTHPISSAEQYFKETQAMEALEYVLNSLTDDDYLMANAAIAKARGD